MEESTTETGATISVARRRLKILAITFVGISVLGMAGTGGYMAYKKMQESAELTGITGAISTQISLLSSNISTLSVTCIMNQTTTSTSSATGNISNAVPNQSPTLPSSTKRTMIMSTEQSTNVTGTPTSTRSYTLEATSSFPHSWSTRPITSLNVSDLCVDESSTICQTGSENSTIPKYCECDADGLWTIIQRRLDGSVDFYRNWTDYREGFGDANCEYWLGNDAIHQITSTASYMLKIVLTDWEGATRFALYDTFRIADEADGYRLTIEDYSGDAGNSLSTYHNGFMFTTKDRDNDIHAENCAENHTGAWWYRNCYASNLNGKYYSEPNSTALDDGIVWFHWGGTHRSLKETKMMIKPK